jgi:hypothetical protein
MGAPSLRPGLFYAMTALLLLLPLKMVTQSRSRKVSDEERKKAHQLHDAAVAAYYQGADINAPVSAEIKAKFPDKAVEKLSGKGPDGQTLERVKTLREILENTEATIGSGDPEIHLTVESQPSACAASYTPVIGGTTLDLGMTNIEKVVNPKFYVVACACKGQVLKKTVDCTRNQKIVFPCNN